MCYRDGSERGPLRALGWALDGLRAAWLRERHFRWQVALALGALSAAGLAAPSPVEWAVLIVACVAVLTAQLFNLVSELVLDVVVSEYNPLVRRAKDAAAGAVLLAAVGAVTVFSVILGPARARMWDQLLHLITRRPAVPLLWSGILLYVCWMSFRPPRGSGGRRP